MFRRLALWERNKHALRVCVYGQFVSVAFGLNSVVVGWVWWKGKNAAEV
jgi:hypothetical protein